MSRAPPFKVVNFQTPNLPSLPFFLENVSSSNVLNTYLYLLFTICLPMRIGILFGQLSTNPQRLEQSLAHRADHGMAMVTPSLALLMSWFGLW